MEKFLWKIYEATLLPPQPADEPPQLVNVLNDAEDDGWEVYSIFSPKPSRALLVCRRPAPELKSSPTKRAKK